MSTELYKRYRPRSLERMVGNEEALEALASFLRKRKLPHVLLFHGPSGCGKTTLARILTKELQCGPLDFKEKNCSSARGVDDIREIERMCKVQPAESPCRVWLLDEVHQLTKDAQHASLKLLEDTPKHVYFFLCTTDPQKLLPTIRTRATHIQVRLLTEKEMQALLARVSLKEKIKLSQETTQHLINLAAGSARSALVLLEKIAQLPEKKRLKAMQQAADEEQESIHLCRALIKRESWKKVAGILKNLKGEPESVRRGVLGYARSCLLGGGPVAEQAFVILQAFETHFYDSGEAGLARACFESIIK